MITNNAVNYVSHLWFFFLAVNQALYFHEHSMVRVEIVLYQDVNNPITLLLEYFLPESALYVKDQLPFYSLVVHQIIALYHYMLINQNVY